ncbi:MAG: PatB family C-S lyase [Lachnospiraceae bacterium]|jgi:cystathionine beta-lyase|nr:PatB family C-S lyase [Lachnospiraceae bacterium]
MYNFDEIIDRTHTNALNTDGFRGYIFHAGPEKVFPYADDEFVRMWVADMEFAVAPEICDALKARIDRRIFGYTGVYDDEYYQSFNKWCVDHYDWTVPKEELTFSPGIIPALFQLVETLCAKDEKVIINTPSYGYFAHAAEYNHVEFMMSPLKRDEKGHFTLDLENFEKCAADPKAKLVIFCNPHNPTGRMWTEEELSGVAKIVEKYNLWIISDEIHCDLIRAGKKHIPMAKVMTDYPKLITCMSASKTFNMAGLQFSNIIIRDPATRAEFIAADKIGGFVNPLSLAGQKAAYDVGGAWHEEMKAYLDENFRFLKQFLDENLPKAVMEIPEATYLAWVDLSAYFDKDDDLPSFFAYKAGVLLEGGDSLFVGNANRFIRLNLAMPRSIIKTGLERMRDAITAKNA